MLNLETSTFPVLSTERLVLRQLVPEYAISLHKLRSDDQVSRYLDRAPSKGIDQAIAFIRKIDDLCAAKQGMYWAITLAGDNNLIGTICFWNYDLNNDTIELGYELMPKHQGKGIMAEAVSKVLAYGFDQMNAKVISAFPSANNAPSIALLKKFKFEIDSQLQPNIHGNLDIVLAYSLKSNI